MHKIALIRNSKKLDIAVLTLPLVFHPNFLALFLGYLDCSKQYFIVYLYFGIFCPRFSEVQIDYSSDRRDTWISTSVEILIITFVISFDFRIPISIENTYVSIPIYFSIFFHQKYPKEYFITSIPIFLIFYNFIIDLEYISDKNSQFHSHYFNIPLNSIPISITWYISIESRHYFIFATTKTAIKTSILTLLLPHSRECLRILEHHRLHGVKLLRKPFRILNYSASLRPPLFINLNIVLALKYQYQSEKIEHAHVTVANGIVQLVEVSSFHEKGANTSVPANRPTDRPTFPLPN